MGVPKITPRFRGSLGGLTDLSIESYSPLRSSTGKGHRTKSAKEKGTRDEVQGKASANFQESSLGEVTQDVLNPPATRRQPR